MQHRIKIWNGLAGGLAVATLVALSAGCSSFLSLFEGAPEPFPEAVQMEPTIKPGHCLMIKMSTSGSAATGTTMPDADRYTVNSSGEVSLHYPLTNTICCTGLTLRTLKMKLKEQCAKLFKPDSQIEVQFVIEEGKRSPYGTVQVDGEPKCVGHPGPVDIPATQDLHLSLALKMAGGLTDFANPKKVKITRTANGKKPYRYIDYEAIGKYGKIQDDIILQDGDAIWVDERVF